MLLEGLHVLVAFKQALQLHPDDSEAWYHQGAVLFQLKRYSDALETFEQALQFKPEFPEARLGKERALQALALQRVGFKTDYTNDSSR